MLNLDSQVVEALEELVAAIKDGRYEDPAHDRIYSAIMQAERLLEDIKDAKSR